MTTFDAIVLGTGGVGSAAVLEFARRGKRVLGLDRFGPAHNRGSSHGETRIIRQAYFEHPDYVPLAQAAYGWWDELQAGCPTDEPPLYAPTGLLQIGPAAGEVLRGVRRSAELHGLAIDNLTREEIAARWPGAYVVPDDCEGVYEQNSGYLRVEACVQAQLDQAKELGAELHFDEPVRSWNVESQGVRVVTELGEYSAAKLVIAAGAWARQVLAQPGTGDHPLGWTGKLEVLRKPQFWFAPRDDRYQPQSGMPAVLFELPSGVFYSFPQLGDAIKVAEHSGGTPVADPATVNREVQADEVQRVQEFCTNHLPGVSTQLLRQAVCMYTMTPDQHFIVDRHPHHPQVVFAAGLSGHGFKFTGLLGRAVVDLVLNGSTALPIEFLSSNRPSLA